MLKYILIILLCYSTSFAQGTQIKLSFETEDGDKGSDLIFGLHQDATFGWDEDLNEIFTINAPPPSPYYISTLLNYYDSNLTSQVWGNLDLIPYPTEDIQHTHNFRVWLDGGRKFTIKWELSGINIDSAKIQDEAGGQFINIDLMKSESYFWDNDLVPSLNLKLLVWYNTNINSVKIKDDNINLYPNPTNNIVIIDSQFSRGEMYNLEGIKVLDFTQSKLNVSNYTTGTYFLKLFNNDYVLTKKLIVE